ncbi:MAG TPA: glycoside hydrolase family 2 TIM barrel-domain containing protein [Candidatus Limnocylindrales bacterium]|nr:glycoside hydrolase family 2 TIM barrel-domain containing protein [Candidatus Limnocylindrales bacterium]
MGPTIEFRERLSLDGEWTFVPDPEGDGLGGSTPGAPILVPGCWEAASDAWRGLTAGWYRRTVTIPPRWREGRVVLAFGAVMYHARAYVNGRLAGEHEGGYTPFEIDVTALLEAAPENDLAVHVVNPMGDLRRYPAEPEDFDAAAARTPAFPVAEVPHGKQTWYSSQSGIWQSVWLERRPSCGLRPLRVDAEIAEPAVSVHWAIDPGAAPPDSPTIELAVDDPDGATVARMTVDPGGSLTGTARLLIPDARLWDIGQPNLYRVTARLAERGEARDAVETRFGLREIATRDGRILLNGRPIYLLGVLDQDLYDGTISTPPSRAMLDDQIRKAQALGLNLLRCHIKVPDPAYLEAADEAGLLVWCELPNWGTFTADAARRGRETLAAMVEHLGNHPSVVIWTIINEDWGTRVREEARDRAWLADTYAWLKALDPSRLIVDNSACDTHATPNFHVRSDIADFHVYHEAPDNASRWRTRIDDFARRPSWLWSPFGDARPTGAEPLVLSEFGSWGLPRPADVLPENGAPPWWAGTGRNQLRPEGIRERFADLGLDRIWQSVDDLAVATQWHQFEALQYEVGEMRRHDSIQGYVITELADAYWEANGLLDLGRRPKAFHDQARSFNNPDVVVADLDRRDFFAGDALRATIYLGAYGPAAPGGAIAWRLGRSAGAGAPGGPGGEPWQSGELPVGDWPAGGARLVGELRSTIPDDAESGDATLELRAIDAAGVTRAETVVRLAILRGDARSTTKRRSIAVEDPTGIWRIAERLEAIGHRVGAARNRDLLVASDLSREVLDDVERGGRALVLARSRSAIPGDLKLDRPAVVRARGLPDPDAADYRNPWDGDWVTAWSWLLPGVVPSVPTGNPFGFVHAEIIPDHVVTGYDPRLHRDEVAAGMFAGWVHAPAALIWRFPQGRGWLTITTLRVAPESGPVATAMLDGLIQHALGDGGGS